MNTEEKLGEALTLLNILRTDAYMALDGTWDRTDEGFVTQIEAIEKFFKSVNYNNIIEL